MTFLFLRQRISPQNPKIKWTSLLQYLIRFFDPVNINSSYRQWTITFIGMYIYVPNA